jgi:hypothetical protein
VNHRVDNFQAGLDAAATSESVEERVDAIHLACGIPDVPSPTLLSAPPLHTTALVDVEPKPIEWLWRGRIPLGKLTTFDGDPGVGKSTILADLAARVSTGSPMPDGSRGVHGSVVILTAEDDADDTIRPRLEAAGADLSRVFVVDIDEALPSVVDAADELVATLLHRQARLLIVDPLATFIGSKTQTSKTNSTSQAMFRIKKAARDAGCAVVLVRHLNKDVKQGKAIYRGTNSIAIIGTVRAGLIAGTDPEDPERCVLAVSKANLAAKDETKSQGYRIVAADCSVGTTARVEWLGEVDWHPDEIVGVVNPGKETARDIAVEWLRELLRDGPVLSSEVDVAAKRAGHSMRTVKRAKKEAGVVSTKRFDGRWEYRLVESE